MNRWHRALMGNQVLDEESKKLLYTRHADEGGGTWYGYGWTVRDSPWGVLVKHNGGNRVFFSDFLRYLDQDVDIYYSTSSRDPRMNRLGFKLAQIVFGGEMPEIGPRPGAVIAPGQGPAAPAGSAAARWGLPGTPQGLRAGEFLAAVTGDAAARKAFIKEGLEPGLVERNGLDRLVELLGNLREEMGAMKVQGLQPRGSESVAILIDTGEGPDPLQVILGMEASAPHRITRIELAMGD